MKKIIVLLIVMTALSSVVQATTFNDIEGLDCKPAVESLAHIGIINGVSMDKYAPEKSVTRAELSKMIINSLSTGTTYTKTFPDIQNHWGKEYIEQAAGLGILNGYTDGTFKPDREVTYAEAVAILVRSLGYDNIQNASGKWYDNYINKMNEIGLNWGMEKIDAEKYANRGDIAILLWNTLKDTSNGNSILEKNFSKYNYLKDKKITQINARNGKVVYSTSDLYFYVDEDIDFSDIGGLASGFLDDKNLKIIGLEIDSGKNQTRISGNTKAIKQKGYDIFECKNISGYGEKERANYCEIFVNNKTNKTERVVYYDTTESHFAEKIKVGSNKITIDSKDVYDTSIILHKGETITLKILRTESVKNINKDALLIYDGHIVAWESVPDNSVIREIHGNSVYTYVHNFIDTPIESGKVTKKSIMINNKEYDFAEDCICENVVTHMAVKMNEGLNYEDIKLIAKKDHEVRLFLNEYDEIVKFEFTYDVLEQKEEDENKEEKEKYASIMKNIGIVTRINDDSSNNEKEKVEHRITSCPPKSTFSFSEVSGKFKIGSLVYLNVVKKDNKKEEKNLYVVSSNASFEDLKVVVDYNGYVNDNRLGVYELRKDTEYIEVVLRRSKDIKDGYDNCTMSLIDSSYLIENSKYKTMHLILDKDNRVLRVYAIKEIGTTLNFGIIKKITDVESGDKVISRKVTVQDKKDTRTTYVAGLHEKLEIGDLISFENPGEDKELIVNEVYNHKSIGSDQDLIVKNSSNGKITFKDSEDIMNLKEETFEINGITYYVEDYLFIYAQVTYDKDMEEWIFKSFSEPSMNNMRINTGNRIAIDELTKVIVVYSGY